MPEMMRSKPVLRVVSKLLIPAIMLYAFYVQFHGDFGPGGGFQAGILLASAFILHAIIFDIDTTRRILPFWVVRLMLAIGVLLYAGVGVAGMMLGGNYLDYNPLAASPLAGQHLGIVLVELGVGTTVTFSMIAIFFIFAGQKR